MMNRIQHHLDLTRSQVQATLELMGSAAVSKLGTGRARDALEDPLMLEVARGIPWHLSVAPGRVSGVRQFFAYAEAELSSIDAELAGWGAADVSSVRGARPAPTLKVADHLLWIENARSIRVGHESRKALPFVGNALHSATAIQDRLGAVVSTYRYAIGDYSYEDPAERRFCQVAALAMPHMRHHHHDLLVIDRDRIESIVRNRSSEVMYIGVKANGFGTWSHIPPIGSKSGGAGPQFPSDCTIVIKVTSLGVRVAKKPLVAHSAHEVSLLAREAA